LRCKNEETIVDIGFGALLRAEQVVMMHKRIVEAIQDVLRRYAEEPFGKDIFRCYVMPQKSGGFWQLCVVVDRDKEYFLDHLEHMGKAIGCFFGEGLGVDKRADRIIFS
jgi:hypothetical protein